MRKIPDAEYEKRHQKVRDLLAQMGLDGAFVYYDELHSASGWYLSGWYAQFEGGAVVVPVDGEPAILGGPESEPFCHLDSHVKTTYNVDCFSYPGVEYPLAHVRSMSDAMEQVLGRSPERLGCVGMKTMPSQVIEDLRLGLPATELVDISEQFEKFRILKSDAELEVIRDAYAITDKAYLAMKAAVGPDVPECVIAAAAEGRARAEGGALGCGWRTEVASGPRAAGVVPVASDRKLRPGEFVLVGFSAKFDGYATVFGDLLPVGDVDSDLDKYRQDLVEAFKVAREQLRPGRTGKQMDAAVRGHLEAKGYGPYLLVPFFHGSGLNEADPPLLGPHNEDQIGEGMVIAIDMSMFGLPEFYGGRLETAYVIDADGAQPLSPLVEKAILGE